MALSPQEEDHRPSSLLDALYCEEDQWGGEEEEEEEVENQDDEEQRSERNDSSSLLPLLLLEQDLFWEDEELLSLFSKEKQGSLKQGSFDHSLSCPRKEAVEWMLKVNAHYGFCPLTSILAVNYFDRFLSSFHFQNDKPWMIQLAAVTCLSLAAKVEETHVPLLLDLQVEGTKYAFEAKTIQKMELLVLSTLEWKMNPVTPLSFLDHIIRRLGLKNHLHWEFLRRCERLLVSLLSDWRFVGYLPSVLAAATMMDVIEQIEPCNPLDYQNQLLGVLNITKENVKDCYQLIVEKSGPRAGSKRKYEEMMMMNNNGRMNEIPSSPNGVVDGSYYCFDYWSSNSDSSSDSWEAIEKERRVQEHEQEQKQKHQAMPLQLPALSRIFVDVVGSPR